MLFSVLSDGLSPPRSIYLKIVVQRDKHKHWHYSTNLLGFLLSLTSSASLARQE
jgi:hypothetical protein